MLKIYCPYCKEEREEEEFTYSDEAFIDRPQKPDELSDAQWADYLFMRNNARGSIYEIWCHTAGCRKFFVIKRNNDSDEIEGTYTMEDFASIKAQIKNQAQELGGKTDKKDKKQR